MLLLFQIWNGEWTFIAYFAQILPGVLFGVPLTFTEFAWKEESGVPGVFSIIVDVDFKMKYVVSAYLLDFIFVTTTFTCYGVMIASVHRKAKQARFIEWIQSFVNVDVRSCWMCFSH